MLKFGSVLFLSIIFSPAFSADRDFAGINFGVGISLTLDSGTNDRVSSALVDEAGIVRVSKDQNDIARIMLESHYFFKPNPEGIKLFGRYDPLKWGHGPFIALQPGTDEIIEAIGLGWMIGLKREGEQGGSWNIGLGYVIDPNVTILGDGVTENEALPDGETQVRLRETSQGGALLVVSFNF